MQTRLWSGSRRSSTPAPITCASSFAPSPRPIQPSAATPSLLQACSHSDGPAPTGQSIHDLGVVGPRRHGGYDARVTTESKALRPWAGDRAPADWGLGDGQAV